MDINIDFLHVINPFWYLFHFFLGEWEALYNPNFNYTEFGTIRNMAGCNNFVLSVKTWIERTNVIGIVAL